MSARSFTLTFLSAQIALFAQARPATDGRALYVVTASPTTAPLWSGAAVLRRVSTTRLDLAEVRTVVPASVGTSFVLSNDAARMLIVGAPPYLPKHFEVIEMDHPSHVSSFDLSRNGTSPLRWYFALPPTGEKYFILEVVDFSVNPFRWLPLAEDLHALKEVPASWYFSRFANLSGIQGWSEPNHDQLEVFQFDDGQLTFREGGREVTKTDWFIPKEYRFPEEAVVIALVNNTSILALGGATKGGSPNWDIRVLDKPSNKWSVHTFPGKMDVARGFGAWIAVTIQNPFILKTPPETRQPYVEGPLGFDRYMRDHQLERPGIVYLYNGHTRQEIKIQTNVPDTEVILIDGDIVYYRVKQVIWSAKISDKGLSSPVLVADDPDILQAHWAFFGPLALSGIRP